MAFKIKTTIPTIKSSDLKPAAKHFDIVLGLDFHVLKVPWPVTPCPVTPFSGLIFDPMDYIHCTIPAIPVYSDGGFTIAKNVPMGGTVLINGFYRGAAQSALWGMPSVPPVLGKIKGLGSLVKNLNLLHFVVPQPLFLLPKFFHPHEGEMSHGSETVLTQSMYQSTLYCNAYSCQDVGKVLFNNPTGGFFLNYLTTVMTVLPMGKPVMIGGPKVEQKLTFDDLMNSLMFLGLAAAAKGALKLIGKLLTKLLDKIEGKFPGFGKYRAKVQPFICKYLGEPVDAASGHMTSYIAGFDLPGPIPFHWEANYYSDSQYEGPLGKSIYHSYDISLMIDEAEDTVIMNDTAGRPIVFPTLPKGAKFFNPQEKYELHRSEEGEYFVSSKEGLFYYFNSPQYGSNGHGLLRSIVNRNGFLIRFAYDSKGRLVEIKDSADRIIKVENNNKGQIIALKMLDPELHSLGVYSTLVGYSYDEEGRMLQLIDANGHRNYFSWERQLILSRAFNDGTTFIFHYDHKERCTAALGPNGLFSYTFVYEHGCTIATNAVGAKKRYYHKDGIVTRIVNSRGGEQIFTYDDCSNLIAESNESGQIKTYSYDERGNTIAIGLPGQGQIAIQYNDKDKPVLVQTPSGAQWLYSYDEAGNLLKRTNPEEAIVQYQYNYNGLLESIVNSRGVKTSLYYNQEHLIQCVMLANGVDYRYNYDILGRCTNITLPTGTYYRRKYDLMGNVIAVDNPDGNQSTIDYDRMGNAIKIKDKHAEIELAYNFFGKVTQRKQADSCVRFVYDLEGQLTTVINEQEEHYSFELDSERNVIKEIGFDGVTRSYLRDAGARVAQVTKADGSLDSYEYDAAGRIITVYHQGDDSAEQYAYDQSGLLIQAINKDALVELKRDVMGRIVQETCNGQTVSSVYNNAGYRVQTTSSLGADIALDYDPMLGVVRSMDANGWQAQMEYNDLGQELLRKLHGGLQRQQSYDSIGRLTQQRIIGPKNRQLHKREYTWDADRLTGVKDSLTGQKLFKHDVYGNLAEVIYADGSVEYRVPDIVGNLYQSKEQTDRIYGKAGQLQESRDAVYHYDKLGNLIQKLDKRRQHVWKYEWDQAGMLAKVIRPDAEIVCFRYDALGRRIEKQYRKTSTKWLWDGNKPLHEWKELEGKDVCYDDAITWVFEEGSFVPTAKLKKDKKYSILADHLGTPTQMYDEEGLSTWRVELDSYGKVRLNTGNTVGECPFRYQGQYEDVETGLYYNRFRYYDPESGNYITQDPIRLAGNNPTLYGYVRDTNSWVDVFGLSCESVSTPYGDAVQSDTPEALAAVQKVKEGATLYRMGTIGRSEAVGAQFWALEHPNSPGYADRYGIPPENIANSDFIMTAQVKQDADFITRPAPAMGSNGGGGIEVVTPNDGVNITTFSTF